MQYTLNSNIVVTLLLFPYLCIYTYHYRLWYHSAEFVLLHWICFIDYYLKTLKKTVNISNMKKQEHEDHDFFKINILIQSGFSINDFMILSFYSLLKFLAACTEDTWTDFKLQNLSSFSKKWIWISEPRKLFLTFFYPFMELYIRRALRIIAV